MKFTLARFIIVKMAVVVGFILDLIFGDPQKMPHLVRLMGVTIQRLEALLRSKKKTNRIIEINAGAQLVLAMLFLYGILPMVLLGVLYQLHWGLGLMVESFICYQMLAAHSLKKESMKVYDGLSKNDIEEARFAVSMIVGRDTKVLDQDGIIRAAVETVAENTSDGVIAPLFYMCIGGGALAMAYKAVNTMDSMVGYHNERYENFGYFAAKLDDLVNWIPARVSAVLMIIAAFLLRYDGRNAYRIFKRDRYNHKSPNSAQTESVCAGALNLRLAGDAYYFGKLVSKPYIGDDLRKIEPEDIVRANRLMYGTTWLAFVIFMLLGGIVGVSAWWGYLFESGKMGFFC